MRRFFRCDLYSFISKTASGVPWQVPRIEKRVGFQLCTLRACVEVILYLVTEPIERISHCLPSAQLLAKVPTTYRDGRVRWRMLMKSAD